MEVHRVVGPGLREVFYQLALAEELKRRSIDFEREKSFRFVYKGTPLDVEVRPDFVAFGEVIIEVKAIKEIGDMERSQAINYLKATGMQRALLLNFGPPSLEFERYVNTAYVPPT
ncbi:GxxExxY protein [bacterium]|nr:GxxExxY protein [bacterium]